MCVQGVVFATHINKKLSCTYTLISLYYKKREQVNKKSTKNRTEKRTKDMNRHFTEEETRMEKMFNPLVTDANKDHNQAFSTYEMSKN